ncbi:MAG: DUF983 domain-containing protein [Tepidiformaceae bacterium]
MKRLVAVLKMRCPRCLKGSVYRGFLRMREACPVCGLIFEREPGYFLGAMYASYTIGFVLTLPVWLTLLLIGQSLGVIMGVSIVLVVLLMPMLFHYSRVAWMHFDYMFNPKTFENDPRY